MLRLPQQRVLSFTRNFKKETADTGPKWNVAIYGRRDGKSFTTVLVPDAASKLPTSPEQYWLCTVAEEPKFRKPGLELFTVNLEEVVWEGPLDIAFDWAKTLIQDGFRFEWQAKCRVGERLTTFVIDRKTMEDSKALKPTMTTALCPFHCRITKRLWISEDGQKQTLAVEPLKQMSPPAPIPVAEAVARLQIGDEVVSRNHRSSRTRELVTA